MKCCRHAAVAALFWLVMMEERPLPGRADIPAGAPPATPAE